MTSSVLGSTGSQAENIYRIMIVDDSSVIRGSIARALEGEADLQITASVGNGAMAISSLKRETVDVIILDIEMPVMDGLTALPLLKEVDNNTQIIMASTLTQKNAEVSMRALSMGATDYIPKPSASSEIAGSDFKRDLIEKIRSLGALSARMRVLNNKVAKLEPTVAKLQSAPASSPATQPAAAPAPRRMPPIVAGGRREVVLRQMPQISPHVIAIGSSTGGPQALFRVIKDMGASLPMPIVITQHMPPSFTTILAEHITRQCDVTCSEAKDGDVLEHGKYYVAPGDYHMLIEKKPGGPTVRLSREAQENFCRPAVDPMLRSLVNVYGRNILTVILTGMGQDGMRGGEVVVAQGGAVIAQDEATSVVWGMPGAVAMAGLCSALLPVNDIGVFVRRFATKAGA